jgi:hypothetical protein
MISPSGTKKRRRERVEPLTSAEVSPPGEDYGRIAFSGSRGNSTASRM